MLKTSMLIVTCLLVAAGCFKDITQVDPELPTCTIAAVDTTGWQRVQQSQADPGGMGGATVSYLVPPSLEASGSRGWERGATHVQWRAFFGGFIDNPYPTATYAGSCAAMISGRRAVLDYGELEPGSPSRDLIVVATWQSVPMAGAAGDLVFHARMKDAADMPLIERMIASVRIGQGAP